MIERLLQFDRDLFIFLNGMHVTWLDQAIFYMSNTYCWLPLYVWLLFLAIKVYRQYTWMILITLTLCITAADQITSSVMKPFFSRLRPSHEPSLKGIVHLVNDYHGGLYGFASSHAANTFALAMLFWLLFRHHYRHMKWLFIWAAIVSFTRIYLGVHYPGDIIGGCLVGLFCGWIGYKSIRLIFGDKITGYKVIAD